MTGDNTWLIVFLAIGVPMFGILALGLALMIRDTIRRRGKWGINLKPAVCTECGTPAPVIRKPKNRQQALWGGWTCSKCGCELDKWGRAADSKPGNAK